MYTWKTNDARQIALYHEHDPNSPIAWFQPSKREFMTRGRILSRALLALEISGEAVIDAVVVSLLVVQQGLRMQDNRWRKSSGIGQGGVM